MAENTNSRLDRIESKLDQLTEAMVAMARAEEKIANLQQDRENLFARMNKHSEKLDGISDDVHECKQTIGVINKLFWVITVAVIGSIVAQIIGVS